MITGSQCFRSCQEPCLSCWDTRAGTHCWGTRGGASPNFRPNPPLLKIHPTPQVREAARSGIIEAVPASQGITQRSQYGHVQPQYRYPIPQATGGADWRTHYPYSFQCHREIPWNCQLIRFPRWYLLNISMANSRINHPTCPPATKLTQFQKGRKDGVFALFGMLRVRETMIRVILVSSVSTLASLQKLINKPDCTLGSFKTQKTARFSLFYPQYLRPGIIGLS